MKIFDEFKSQSAGVWFFHAYDEESYLKGDPCHGFGSIKYAEGSVYTGDIYFDGKNYNKLGFGKQEFFTSTLGTLIPAISARMMLFVGSFDYRKTDWIYGNGVLYYGDENFKPKYFLKGFFSGTLKTGEYVGEFDYSTLIAGFTPDMEDKNKIPLSRAAILRQGLENYTGEYENLFVGDSYFEWWRFPEIAGATFFDRFDLKKNVNLGLGGATYSEYLAYAEVFDKLTAPEKIFINLGFNDIHAGTKLNDICRDRAALVSVLKGKFPAAKLFFVNVVHAPSEEKFVAIENDYNADLAEYAESVDGKIIDYCSAMDSAKGEKELFNTDGVHPGKLGYDIFEKVIKTSAGIE